MTATLALEGDLGRFLATEVLQFLQLTGASGTLDCERAGERVSVGIAHGRPVWAETSGRAVRTGDVLLHRGWASRDDIDAALDEQRERPGERIGELLRQRGVPDEHVEAAVGEVFRRLVCLLTLWPDGRFRFVAGDDVADDVTLDIELDRLILEGLHQADLVHDLP